MRKITLAASGLGLALLLAACGDGEVSLNQSPTPTTATQPTVGDSDALLNAVGEKSAQIKSAKFTFTQAMSGGEMSGQGQARFDGKNSLASGSMVMLGMTFEFRQVGETVYLKYPEQVRAQLGIDKPWARISPEDAATLGGGGDQVGASDPKDAVDHIKKAGTITKTEQVELDGMPTTHYVAEIDVDKVVAQLSEGLPKALTDSVEGKGIKHPLELWVNADQLPVQLVINLAPLMEATGVPAGSLGATTMKYTDWGSPVEISAPPAEEITDFKLPTLDNPGTPTG